MSKAPTLTTIQKLITDNHKEMQIRLVAVEEQVKLTNGRVKALETESAVEKGIKEYQEAQLGSNPKVDWGKLLPYAVALCAALIAIGQAISK